MPTAGPDQPENVAYDNSTSTLNAGCELSSLFASRPMSGRTRPSVCQPVIVLCSLFTLATADYADQHGFFISLFRYANVLRLVEESQCSFAAFPTAPACFNAPDRTTRVAQDPAVH